MALSDTDNCRAEWKKWLIAIWAFLECMVFAGILLGWGSLVFVLKEEGIFSDLCPSSGAVRTYDNTSKSTETSHLSTTNNMTVPTEDAHEPDLQAIDSENVADERDRNQCGIQDDRLALCFTIASAIFCIGGAIMGQINFKFGTRVTRVLGFVSFWTVDLPWLIFPGLSLLGVGGLTILITNIQVCNLFVKGSSTVVGAMNGGFDMSSAVQLAVKRAYQAGFSRQHAYLAITALHSLTLVGTFGFLPKTFITNPIAELTKDGDKETIQQRGRQGTISKTYPKEYIHTKLPCLTPQNDDFQTGQPSLKSQRDGQKDIQNLMSKGDDFQTDLPSLKSQRDRQKDMQNLMSQVDDVQTVLPSLMPQNENHHTKLPNLKSEKEESKTDLPSLMSCIKQPVFISHCLWFSLLLLRFLYFIGSLNNYLNRVLHGDKDLVSYFTDVCFYTLMGGLMSSLFAGTVYDWQKNLCKKTSSPVYQKLFPAVVPLGLASLLFVLFSCMALVSSQAVLYPLIICFTIARSFLYCLASAFLIQAYPCEYFGIMNGIMVVTGGIFSALQYAFFSWSASYLTAPLHVDVCLLALVLVSFLHPVCIFITCKRVELECGKKTEKVEST